MIESIATAGAVVFLLALWIYLMLLLVSKSADNYDNEFNLFYGAAFFFVLLFGISVISIAVKDAVDNKHTTVESCEQVNEVTK